MHDWYPRMALSSMDEVSPSMDGIFICQVFGENCIHHIFNWEFPSNCVWPLKIQCPEAIRKEFSFENMMDIISTKNLMDGNPIHGWRNLIYGWKCHPGCYPWMEKCYRWMSSMDEEMSSMDESVICWCHLWSTLPSVDVNHGWRQLMTDMESALE